MHAHPVYLLACSRQSRCSSALFAKHMLEGVDSAPKIVLDGSGLLRWKNRDKFPKSCLGKIVRTSLSGVLHDIAELIRVIA